MNESLDILIVDDCHDTTWSLAMLVGAWGHRPHVAHDAETALNLAAEVCFDVALLDIGMPRMTGWELAKKLRQLPGLNKLLVVAVSGYASDDFRRRSVEAGCDLYLIKPVEPEQLRQLLAARQEEMQQHVTKRVDPVAGRPEFSC